MGRNPGRRRELPTPLLAPPGTVSTYLGIAAKRRFPEKLVLSCLRLHLWRNWLKSEPSRVEEKLDWLLEYLATAP